MANQVATANFYSDPAFYIFLGELAKTVFPLGVVALFVNRIQSASDKRLDEADKRWAESMNASNARFAELISSMKEIKITENALIDTKYLNVSNVGQSPATLAIPNPPSALPSTTPP